MIACLVSTGCCANEFASEHLSPDGKWKFVTFDRNCGATTGNNMQVSLLPAQTRLSNDAGNAFIADNNRAATRFVAIRNGYHPTHFRLHILPKHAFSKRNIVLARWRSSTLYDPSRSVHPYPKSRSSPQEQAFFACPASIPG